MTKKYISILSQIGLSEHEAAVYLAGLKLGNTSVLQLAKISGIKRTTVYSVVDCLIQHGLMRIDIKGFKKYYVSESPDKLEQILIKQKNLLNNVMPELSSIYNVQSGESLIKYYQGIKSLKSVYEDLITSVQRGDDYLIISDQSKWYELDPEYFEDFTRRRSKLKINIKMLLTRSKSADKFKQKEDFYNVKIKFLPEGTKLSTNLVIIPQKVLIQQTIAPVFAMVIDNKSIIQMHREQFYLIWNTI